MNAKAISLNDIILRPIKPGDNERLTKIILNSFVEFKANHEGTVFDDPTTSRLFEFFDKQGAFYQVAEKEGEVVGGAGIYPTDGLPPGTGELVRMYLSADARGLGIGKMLMDNCLSRAKQMGYDHLYIETKPQFSKAIGMYKRYGFTYLEAPLGNSGHFGCEIWMLKSI